jgi:hypothetical protein
MVNVRIRTQTLPSTRAASGQAVTYQAATNIEAAADPWVRSTVMIRRAAAVAEAGKVPKPRRYPCLSEEQILDERGSTQDEHCNNKQKNKS